jgi:hypothetical protein
MQTSSRSQALQSMISSISIPKLGLATLATGLLASSSFAFQSATQYQLGQRQGPQSVSSAGLVVESTSTMDLLVRSPGVITNPPTEWSTTRFGGPTAIYPDFSETALLLGMNRDVVGVAMSSIEFSGISTGGDVCGEIFIDGSMNLAGWYGLSITLDRKATGQTYGVAGSTLRSLTNASGSVVSHYFAQSTGLDVALVDSTVVEQTDVQMGYASSDNLDIKAMDWAMGAITGDPTGVRTGAIAPVRDHFYFTVSAACVAANPNYVSGSSGTNLLLRTDTIYAMEWTAQAAPESFGWSAPYVAYSATTLFGTANPTPPVEIDAISVYNLPNSSIDRVVFSATAASALPNQIMGYDGYLFGPTTVLAQPLKDIFGDLISDKLGLADATLGTPDDIDSICPIDPEAGQYNGALGTPVKVININEDEFGLAVYRSLELTGETSNVDSTNGTPSYIDSMCLQATGLPSADSESIVLFEFAFLTPSPNPVPINSAKSLTWYYLGAATQSTTSSTSAIVTPGNYPISGPIAFRASHFADVESLPDAYSHLSVLNY